MKYAEVFEVTEQAKPIPEGFRAGGYLTDLVRLVREGDEATRRVAAALRELKEDQDRLLIELGDYLFTHERLLDGLRKKSTETLEPLAALGEKLMAALRRAAVEVEDPVGRELEGEVLGAVEILGWRRSETEEERVDETLAPIVRREGKLIRPGRVIGRSHRASGEAAGGEDDHQ